MDERLKQLMLELGNAINQSLSESDAIAETIGEIKAAGYDVFLVLEATVGFNKTNREAEDPAEPTVERKITLTHQDIEFLKALKIAPAE